MDPSQQSLAQLCVRLAQALKIFQTNTSALISRNADVFILATRAEVSRKIFAGKKIDRKNDGILIAFRLSSSARFPA